MKTDDACILCATDFSPAAGAAAAVAAQLAGARAARLRLVHACDPASARVLARAHERLGAEARRLGKFGPEVEPVLLESARLCAAVLACIRSSMPSLVVVASGVKGPLDRWALGSFAEQLAESSPVPTLVVRHPAAFANWDWTKDRLTVLLALDRYPSSDVVLRWARDFRRAGPCDLVSCTINWRMPTAEQAAIAPGRPVNPPELQARLERELRKKVRDQIGDDAGTVVVRPFFGEPGPCLVEVAAEMKAQVIAVGTHQRHGLRRLAQFSVSRALLHETGTNLVCVPVAAQSDPREAHIPDFRRVLVATDFSPEGDAAVPFAAAACSVGGRLRLVHVVPVSRRTGGSRGAELRRQLQERVPNELGARGQPAEVAVLEARDVAGAICAEAARFGADLVCLASHGRGLSRAWHGSVAKAVLKQIRRPLLVIRRPEE